jgi:hypothetical protein
MSALARFASLLLGALNCGLSFAHLVEMVPKRAMNGRDWLTTQQAYRDFGRVARITMPGQLLATLATLALDRDDRANALLTGIDAACTTATVVIWAQFNEPVNREIVRWDPTALPDDWAARRDQWEFAHAASALLHIIGLSALIVNALRARGRS